MARTRDSHPGNVGWAERARPAKRLPPVLTLFEPGTGPRTDGVELAGVKSRLGAKSFLFGDFQAPTDAELASLQRELNLHPLAIDDVQHRHQGPEKSRLAELLDLKKDLALLRRVIAPERDAVNVLLRRDPPVLDVARIFYFQDVYDHLIRITDSIDTYRELA